MSREDDEYTADLRQAAEQQMRGQDSADRPPLPSGPQQLVAELLRQRHELQVHQIELELQNQELRRAQAQLELAYQEYTDLFDRAPVGYVTVDASGMIGRANLQAARQLGLERARLTGRRFPAFLESADVSSFALLLRRTFAGGGPQRAELRLLGEGLVVQVEGEVIPQEGGHARAARLTLTDITVQRRAQEHVLDLNATLEQRVKERTAQLSELNQELEMMVYGVMHDMQTPLRHIQGFAQALLAADTPETRQQHAAHIEQASAQMERLVFDLQAYFRAGQQRLHFRPVELSRLLSGVLNDHAAELRGRGVQVTQGTLPTVYGDPLALHLVLSNLIGNALKFTRGRAPARVHISARRGEREMVVGVQDNGVGFNARQKGRLFGLFQRLHPEGDFPGTGVGLALVRRIVHRHGGRVWAESTPEQGATFWFALPLRAEA